MCREFIEFYNRLLVRDTTGVYEALYARFTSCFERFIASYIKPKVLNLAPDRQEQEAARQKLAECFVGDRCGAIFALFLLAPLAEVFLTNLISWVVTPKLYKSNIGLEKFMQEIADQYAKQHSSSSSACVWNVLDLIIGEKPVIVEDIQQPQSEFFTNWRRLLIQDIYQEYLQHNNSKQEADAFFERYLEAHKDNFKKDVEIVIWQIKQTDEYLQLSDDTNVGLQEVLK
jgi:hypothetical protein